MCTMLRLSLTAALAVAFIEVGAQTPPAPPAVPTPATPAAPPAARAPRAPTPAPRPAPFGLFDDTWRDFDHTWPDFDRDAMREEMQRAREMSQIDQEEVRRLAREAREEARHSLEFNREHIEEARRMAERDWSMFQRDFTTPFPAIAPMPLMPPDTWDDALRRFERPTPAPRAFVTPEIWASETGHRPDLMPRAAWLPQDPADSLYRVAREHLTRGQYRSAAETFRLLSQKYPSSGYAPDGMYYEAFSLYKIGGQNELRAALDVLEKQKSRFPKQNNPDPALPTRIRGELANRGDRNAAEAVSAAAASQGQSCNKDEMAVRIEALNALSRMSVDSTTPILRRVLTRRDECSITLRRQAITLMAKNPDAATTDLMIDVLKNDPAMEVRRAALSWLSEVPSERGAAAIDEILRSPRDEELHNSALRALASPRNPRSSQALRTVIERKDVSESLRGEAMSSLVRIDSVNAGAYLRSIYPKLESRALQRRALTSIARVRDADSQKWMLSFVRDTTQPVELRRDALSTLTRSQTTTVAEVASLYAQVPELELRQQIITSLASRKEPEAVDQLITIYRGTTDTKLKMQIINVLSRRDDPRTQKLLIEILNK
jgi:TolA-binding protein/HEAT repeat protein